MTWSSRNLVSGFARPMLTVHVARNGQNVLNYLLSHDEYSDYKQHPLSDLILKIVDYWLKLKIGTPKIE